ncbi:MAG: class I SAM-dependent methyltransferase [Rhizomicrobium sp.]
MIANAWPGDTARRKAIHGNWLEMPLHRPEFTAAIGDGVMAAIAAPQYSTFFSEITKVLVPDARFAVRLYETPEPGETIAQVREQIFAKQIKGFHAFKWRLAMALASESKNAAVPVAAIHRTFQETFPDRETLSAATGWSLDEIAEIDAYAGKPMIYQFHTRAELLAHLPSYFINPRFLDSGDYELAERCPIFVVDFQP